MQTIWLMYSDETETEVVGWSNWEQARETWPVQEEMGIDDPRYAAYYNTCFDWVKAWMPVPIQN